MPFKKIFKPIAKVLDKVIPNEIKPALPYIAAFAPVFGPTAGMFGNTMMKRALLSGGANILGQLSQEGSEGDINLLSAGLGALTGAMTVPQGPDKLVSPGGQDLFRMKGTPGSAEIFRNKAAEIGTDTLRGKGLEVLAKGSDILRPGGGLPDLFSTEGLKAATIPAATATGDVMAAEARRSAKEVADAALLDLDEGASDADRALAIRTAMEAYGYFSDDEIEETITAAGYKKGGRVGFDNGGGLFSFLSPDEGRDTFSINEAVAENMQIGKLPYETTSMILKLNRDGKSVEEISEITGIDISDVGEMLSVANRDLPIDVGDSLNKMLAQNVEIQDRPSNLSYKAKGGRVGYRFGGIDAAIDKVEDESIKESMKFASDIGDMNVPMVDLVEQFEIIFKRKPSSLDELKQFYRDFYEYKGPGDDVRIRDKIEEKVVMKAKDGGLMNLGGKEMDLRGGGFVPIGKKERADDVPARLSKNEFVMTADAVRAAGGGSVNKGAKRMYELMNNLEARV